MLRKAEAQGLLGGSIEDIAASIPVRRIGRPEDIAATCAFLVSEEAGYITGQIVGVNGGRCTMTQGRDMYTSTELFIDGAWQTPSFGRHDRDRLAAHRVGHRAGAVRPLPPTSTAPSPPPGRPSTTVRGRG